MTRTTKPKKRTKQKSRKRVTGKRRSVKRGHRARTKHTENRRRVRSRDGRGLDWVRGRLKDGEGNFVTDYDANDVKEYMSSFTGPGNTLGVEPVWSSDSGVVFGVTNRCTKKMWDPSKQEWVAVSARLSNDEAVADLVTDCKGRPRNRERKAAAAPRAKKGHKIRAIAAKNCELGSSCCVNNILSTLDRKTIDRLYQGDQELLERTFQDQKISAKMRRCLLASVRSHLEDDDAYNHEVSMGMEKFTDEHPEFGQDDENVPRGKKKKSPRKKAGSVAQKAPRNRPVPQKAPYPRPGPQQAPAEDLDERMYDALGLAYEQDQQAGDNSALQRRAGEEARDRDDWMRGEQLEFSDADV